MAGETVGRSPRVDESGCDGLPRECESARMLSEFGRPNVSLREPGQMIDCRTRRRCWRPSVSDHDLAHCGRSLRCSPDCRGGGRTGADEHSVFSMWLVGRETGIMKEENYPLETRQSRGAADDFVDIGGRLNWPVMCRCIGGPSAHCYPGMRTDPRGTCALWMVGWDGWR